MGRIVVSVRSTTRRLARGDDHLRCLLLPVQAVRSLGLFVARAGVAFGVPYEELAVLTGKSELCLGVVGTATKTQGVMPN
jgi:hypothetical protein